MRQKSIERPPVGRSIRIVLDGQEYDGTFTVDGPTLTLHSMTLGVRVGVVGDYAPEVLAKLLLAELAYRAATSRPSVSDHRESEIGSGLIDAYARDTSN